MLGFEPLNSCHKRLLGTWALLGELLIKTTANQVYPRKSQMEETSKLPEKFSEKASDDFSASD